MSEGEVFTCRTCGIEKAIELFAKDKSKKDGHATQCKECFGKYLKEYRISPNGIAARKRYEGSQKGKETRESYNSSEKRRAVSMRHYHEGGGREQKRRWRNTDKAKEIMRKVDASQKNKHPEKYCARKAVNHAVERGTLPRVSTLKCEFCESKASQYHHWSYAKEHWLDVIPVCHGCHSEQDEKVRTANRQAEEEKCRQ